MFGENALLKIADLALQFEDSFNGQSKTAAENWNEKGLMHGQAGKGLVRIYRGSLTGKKKDRATWEATVLSLSRILDEPLAEDIPMGIANGLSGWGIALHEGYILTKNTVFLDFAYRIGDILIEKIDDTLPICPYSDSFMNGLTGIAYFLQQLQSTDSFILPESVACITKDTVEKTLSAGSTICLSDTGKRLLSRSMGRSVQMLEEEFPGEMRSFFENHCAPSPADLVQFAKGLDMQKLTGVRAVMLTKTMEKEHFITTIDNPLHYGEHPENNENIFKINRIFELSMEGFMQLRFVAAKNSLLLDQEDPVNIDFNKAIPPEMLGNLLMVYGNTTFHFKMNKYNYLEETTLGMRKLFMYLFAKEDTVRGGLDRFLGFVKLQNKEVVESLKKALSCNTDSELMDEVKGIFFRNIRALLINELLDCTSIKEHEIYEKCSGFPPFIGLANGTSNY